VLAAELGVPLPEEQPANGTVPVENTERPQGVVNNADSAKSSQDN
jgi:hypothetical protein